MVQLELQAVKVADQAAAVLAAFFADIVSASCASRRDAEVRDVGVADAICVQSAMGDRVEDSFVLRRICKFAMKEGRLDIAEKARRWGDHDLRARKVDRTEREVLGWPSPRKGHRRLPMSRLFPRNGQEAAKWQRLCAKLRRYARETKRESTTAT